MAAQSQQPNEKVPSEDIIARKTDLCISNAIVKTGLGFGVGVVSSVILFRRRAWPVWLSTGFGAGSAYNDCERSFNPYSAPGLRLQSPPPSQQKSSSSSSSSSSTVLERLSQKTGEVVGTAKEQAKPKIDEAKKEISAKKDQVEKQVSAKKEQVESQISEKTKQAEAKGQEAKDAVEKKIRQV
ncbi:unnamed protein product [Sympodiomycopsis kandeliae]